jgi:hypothetical protein
VRRLSVIAACLFAAAGTPAFAADVWTDPFPGIRYLHRSTDEPKEIHALLIDLLRPEISLRATKNNEKGRTTTSFSNLVGAAAAVNGDFYNTDGSYDPVGLAIGDGVVWSDDTTGQRFLACSAAKACEIDTTGRARAPDPSWIAAVGGNTLLVNDGAIAQTASDDTACGSFCTTAHPRTAVGISADGKTLILVVVEGRQTPILGMSTSRLAELMFELGAGVALNLDGGGSSAMVVNGARVSGRPSNEPSERSVANHLAILYDASLATSGRLVGFVRENDLYDTNAGLRGARVVSSSGDERTTDDRGFYEFTEVDAGDVTIDVTLDGFMPVRETKTITAGTTNWKSVAMVRAVDAGVIEPDAGVVVEDPDAGVEEPDAAVEASDAGVETNTQLEATERGCTCTSPKSRDHAWYLLFVLLAWFRSSCTSFLRARSAPSNFGAGSTAHRSSSSPGSTKKIISASSS